MVAQSQNWAGHCQKYRGNLTKSLKSWSSCSASEPAPVALPQQRDTCLHMSLTLSRHACHMQSKQWLPSAKKPSKDPAWEQDSQLHTLTQQLRATAVWTQTVYTKPPTAAPWWRSHLQVCISKHSLSIDLSWAAALPNSGSQLTSLQLQVTINILWKLGLQVATRPTCKTPKQRLVILSTMSPDRWLFQNNTLVPRVFYPY